MNAGESRGGDERNLAFLIIAHHQPRLLARLIRALDDEGSHFFIHIDAKSDLAPFRAAVPDQPNIAFLSDRLDVQWAKLSVVQATLTLIDAAVESGRTFRYFTLLSGGDYPIKHRAEIAARLRRSDCQYLRIDRRLTPGAPHANVIEGLPGGRFFDGMAPYHGSMYWSLTSDCIDYVRRFVSDNPGYLEIHRNIFAPDEVFFHTLIRHSPFAASITQDFADGGHANRTEHANHFIDWAGLRRRRQRLVLDKRDFRDLLASSCLFARKFDERASARLLDRLDAHVHGLPPPRAWFRSLWATLWGRTGKGR